MMLKIKTDIPMNMPITASITSKKHLAIGGCDVIDLAQEFGTPLWLIDEETIRKTCKEYIDSFNKYGIKTEIVYASKALSNIAILQVIKEEGLSLDVVSGGELYTALKSGFDPEKIYFHGNNKSQQELKEAVMAGVGRIVVDNEYELELLLKVCQELDKKTKILIRINPGIEAHTHEFIQTGKVDSKFGIAKDSLINFLNKIKKQEYIEFKGLHVHIGSQIQEIKPFMLTIEEILDFWKLVRKKTGLEMTEFNLGGGLGIEYLSSEISPSISQYANNILKTISFKLKELKLPNFKLILEPGRSIIGKAGVTLYTIGVIKEIKEIRKYVCIDGGMTDNPRSILYDAHYDAVIANKILEPKDDLVTIAGKACESGDLLIKNFRLQKAKPGDILTVFCTGAYNYSMASNYNRHTKPAILLLKDGKAKVILKRETYEDLIRNDLPLS